MARKLKRHTLGPRIRRLRQSREMSLETLANETGYARGGYLQCIENDEAIPPVAVLLSLSRTFEIDSGELLKDEEEETKVAERRAEAMRKRTDYYSHTKCSPPKSFLVGIEAASDLERPGRGGGGLSARGRGVRLRAQGLGGGQNGSNVSITWARATRYTSTPAWCTSCATLARRSVRAAGGPLHALGRGRDVIWTSPPV